MKMDKIISFCLYGDNPKYTIGAIKNAKLAKTLYPDWKCMFFCDSSVSVDIINRLKDFNNTIVIMKDGNNDAGGMFWRFEPISYSAVDVMIVRDTDSRLSEREVAAVNDWLDSGKLFHIMHDHPWHGPNCIVGCMFGIRKPLLTNIISLIEDWPHKKYYNDDQHFLNTIILPMVKNETCYHDEINLSIDCPFPTKRIGLEFVGNVFNEHDEPMHPEFYLQLKQRLDLLGKY